MGDNFTLVLSPVKKAKKSSTLFAYLTHQDRLKQTVKQLNLAGYKLDETYIIFKLLPNAHTHNIYQNAGYSLQEGHLRIDKFYYKPTSLSAERLSHWHHTTTYINQNQELLIVRVYFSYGTYLYSYVTTTHNGTQELIEPKLLEKALANARVAREIINQLLSNLNNYKIELALRFQTALDKLNNLAYLKKTVIAKLHKDLQACKLLSDEVNNLHEDCLDPRYQRVADLIEYLSKKDSTKQEQALATENISENKIAITLQAAPKLVSKAELLTEEIKLLTQDIDNVINDATTTPLVIIHRRQEKLQARLQKIYTKCKNKTHGKKLLGLDKRIATLPKLVDHLLAYAVSGQTAQFIEAFREIQYEISRNFYSDFLFNLTNYSSKNIDLTKEYLAICEFLYKESDEYRFLLSYLDQILIEIGDNLACSVFYLLARQQKYEIFTLLYQQANIKCCIGIFVNERYIPLLTAIARIHQAERFINLLLAEGDNFNSFAEESNFSLSHLGEDASHKEISQYFNDPKHQINSNVKSDKEIKTNQLIQAIYRSIAIINNPLYAYSLNDNCEPDVISKLSKQSSDVIILLAFLNMIQYSDIIIFPTHLDNKQIAFSSVKISQEQRSNLQAKSGQAKYLCFSIVEENLQKLQCIQTIIEIMQQRYSNINVIKFLSINQELNEIKRTALNKSYHLGYNCLLAHVYLQNYRTLDQAMHQGIVLAFDNLIKFINTDNDTHREISKENAKAITSGFQLYKNNFIKNSIFLGATSTQNERKIANKLAI